MKRRSMCLGKEVGTAAYSSNQDCHPVRQPLHKTPPYAVVTCRFHAFSHGAVHRHLAWTQLGQERSVSIKDLHVAILRRQFHGISWVVKKRALEAYQADAEFV